MPWSNNSGGPWGGGGSSGGGGNGGGGNGNGPWGGGPSGGGGRGPGGGGGGQQPPDLDELFRQGQERFRRAVSRNGSGGPGDPLPGKVLVGIGAILLVAAWVYASVFQVETNEKAIVLTLGEYSPPPRSPGLNFAAWPIQTHETLQVTDERSVEVGVDNTRVNRGRSAVRDEGLMLTGDENVVDVNFQIVWNISDPSSYLFNLALPEQTIEAVSEASIREVIGKSEIQPVLNRDGIITQDVRNLIQTTLDGYQSGVNVIRVNFVSVAPPDLVVEAFDDVTKATQEQESLQLQAEGYSRQKLADARGESAQLLENADGYAARVVKDAEGEAARFKAIQEEYAKAPEVTRQRLYLETMERVLGGIDKIILDESVGGGGGGSGVVPYLPLNELGRNNSNNRRNDQ
jgi:membrane protease subunit HflK